MGWLGVVIGVGFGVLVLHALITSWWKSRRQEDAFSALARKLGFEHESEWSQRVHGILDGCSVSVEGGPAEFGGDVFTTYQVALAGLPTDISANDFGVEPVVKTGDLDLDFKVTLRGPAGAVLAWAGPGVRAALGQWGVDENLCDGQLECTVIDPPNAAKMTARVRQLVATARALVVPEGEVLDRLVARLDSEPDECVRYECERALMIAYPEHARVPTIRQHILQDDDPGPRLDALVSVDSTSVTEVLDQLSRVDADRDPGAVARAIPWLAARFEPGPVADALTAMLAVDHPAVVVRAVDVLADRGHAPLIRALPHDGYTSDVNLQVVRALRRLGLTTAEPFLLSRLGADDTLSEERAAILDALVVCGKGEGAELLREQLGGEDEPDDADRIREVVAAIEARLDGHGGRLSLSDIDGAAGGLALTNHGELSLAEPEPEDS